MPYVLLGLSIAACKGGRGDADDALSAEGLPEECEPGEEDALRRAVQESVIRIRIAQSNADLKLMDDHEQRLTALARCGDAFDRMCDAECAAQRASVHLFKAAALPLLSSKGPSATTSSGATLSESDQLREAATGIELIDKALAKLPRQRGFDAREDAADSQGVGGFNQYLKSYAMLQAIRAELNMLTGDVYYRRVSTAHSRAVSFVASEVLGDRSGRGPMAENKGSDLERAMSHYEEAYWTLLDARTSVPAELGNSPLFGAELNKLFDLTQQVGERLRSTREGKLFIGIDPSGLQDGARPSAATLDELMAQLERQRVAIQGVEGEVANKMSEWASRSKELTDLADDLAQQKNSRAVDLAVQKMQAVRDAAEERAAPIKRAVDDIELAKDDFELEGRIKAAELQLEASRRTLENDLVALAAKNEEDLLDRRMQDTQLGLDVVRNAIDSTLADYNFDMQLSALRQQELELGHDRAHEQQNLTALDAQFRQVEEDIRLQQAELQNLRLEIQGLGIRKSEVVRSQVESIQSQIRAMDADIGFLTAQAGFIDQICAARAELSQKTDAELQIQAQCLSGGSCGPGNLTTLYSQLLENKKTRHDKMIEEAQRSRDLLLGRIREAQATLGQMNNLTNSRRVAVLADMAAMMVAAAVPTVTFEAGIPPSVATTIDPVRILQPAVEATRDLFQVASEKLQFGHQVDAELSQARVQLEQMSGQLAQANVEKTIADIEHKQALAELHVRLLDVREQQVLNQGQMRANAIECRQDGVRNVGDLARTRAERQALEAQLGVQAGERSILDVQLDQQSARIAQAEATIRKHEAQKDELAVRQAQARSAIAHVDRMLDAVHQQMAAVGVYQGKIKELASQRDALQEQLKQHVEQISLVRLGANEQQRQFVLAAIEDAERAAFVTIEGLKQQLEANAKLRELARQLAVVEGEARVALGRHRDELIQLIEERPMPTSSRVIWDFEDISARLTRGAAELLEYKRSLLNSTNYYYNAYRYRYNLLSELVGAAPISDATPYIWTAADATQRLSQCAELGTTALCSSSSLANNAEDVVLNASTFSISANSPMFQELLRTRRTRFELAEYAASKQRSAELGNFVLWDEENMAPGRDMRVVGFYLAFPDLEGCNPSLTKIRHTGLGYRDGAVVMRAPLAARPTIIPAGQSPEEVPIALEARVASWTQNTQTVMQLERRLASGAEGPMPFLGYPLRGVYEITSDSPMECLRKISQMYLTVVFATR